MDFANFIVSERGRHFPKAVVSADALSPDGIQARPEELQKELVKKANSKQDFIAKQETDVTEFDESLVKKLIEKITVYPDRFTVEFKSGIKINIEA